LLSPLLELELLLLLLLELEDDDEPYRRCFEKLAFGGGAARSA